MDFTYPGNCRNKRRRDPAAELPHFWKGERQRSRHILPGHIAGGKHELPDGISLKRPFLQKVITELLVRCEQNPAILSDKRQPCFVGHAAREMSKVLFAAHTNRFQGFENGSRITEVFVEIKSEFFRLRRGALAPTGWLLRPVPACSHIRVRGPQRIRVRGIATRL